MKKININAQMSDMTMMIIGAIVGIMILLIIIIISKNLGSYGDLAQKII
tara:strand:+ start:540 stop:686 length:147 start_codon:yes stop_codon:yes gene_type:complete